MTNRTAERDEAAEHRAQNHLVGERLRGRAVYYADQKAVFHKIDAIEVIFVFPQLSVPCAGGFSR